MRPVNKGNSPKDSSGNEIQFKDYKQARRYLIDRIGEYCSYCERKIVASLAVEHVQPKLPNPTLALSWSNFLLACTNCNSTKGKINTGLNDYFWADKYNTYRVFDYSDSGKVIISNNIKNVTSIKKARSSIKLVGLDKIPPNKGTVEWEEAYDRRFEHRIQAFKLAQDYEKKYSAATLEIRLILLPYIKDIVVFEGFWSIWMRAFENFPEVQKELIFSFKGTRKKSLKYYRHP